MRSGIDGYAGRGSLGRWAQVRSGVDGYAEKELSWQVGSGEERDRWHPRKGDLLAGGLR